MVETEFRKSVRRLAELRKTIPKEILAMSGVPAAITETLNK